MKKVYNLAAALSLSLLAVGANAQEVMIPKVVNHGKKMVRAVSIAKHKSHKSTAYNTNLFMDYAVSDSVITNGYGLGYSGSPSIGSPGYIQDFNSRYNVADSGATASNNTLIHSFAVVFDTLLDAFSDSGYSYKVGSWYNGVTVDSLLIPIGQQNVSGMNDTLIIQITGVTKGSPNATVLWSKTIIQDTGLSGKGNNFLYGYELLLTPNLAVNGPFAVNVQYFSGSNRRDSCGFLYGFPTSECGGNAIPDTTKVGAPIAGAYKLNAALDSIKGSVSITANSFLTGWQYISAGTETATNPILTMPSKQTYNYPTNTYLGGDDYFGQTCTSGSNTVVSSNGYQDVAIYALVAVNVDGVNSIKDNDISVGQNYPNPFNKSSVISYNLVKSSDVVFTVNDITGRQLVNNSYSNVAPGQHQISLTANEFTPGVYFYTFVVNGKSVTKKMVITE